jgi:hypothetical protein
MAWRHMGKWRYSSTILDLGTRWRWVFSFTPLPLYPWGKSPGTHWIGGWVGPRREKSCIAGNRTRVVQPVAIPTLVLILIASLNNKLKKTFVGNVSLLSITVEGFSRKSKERLLKAMCIVRLMSDSQLASVGNVTLHITKINLFGIKHN